MPPSKRRKTKTPIPAKPHNPFHRAWTVAAGFLVLILGIPTFIGAVQGQSIGDSSPLGTQTVALLSALGKLGQEVGLLTNEIRSLRAVIAQSGQTQPKPDQEFGEGIPECLNACRDHLSSCLESQSTPTGPAGVPPLSFIRIAPSISGLPSVATLPPLDKCRTQANKCVNRCRPGTAPVVSCEDRCAVTLGGCLDAAGTDQAKLLDCRLQNHRCLLAACRPGTTDGAALDRVPSGVCREQCTRMLTVCREVAKYDEKQLEACEVAAKTCFDLVCAPDGMPPKEGGGTSPTAPGQQKTVECENACTNTFGLCRRAAGSDQAALAKCDTSFGSCREACIVP